MSTINSCLRIPTELADVIIDFLHDDRTSLGNCALACKLLVPHTRMYLFKHVKAKLRQDSEPRWKELLSLLEQTPSLRSYIKELWIAGERLPRETRPVLGPAALGITQSAFAALTELHLDTIKLPSVEHLVALVLSLPTLEELSCCDVAYAGPGQGDITNETRWYSSPFTLPTPSTTSRRALKTVELIQSLSTDGVPLGTAAEFVTRFMDGSLHVAVESLIAIPGLCLTPLVRACAPTLQELTISFGEEDVDAAADAARFFDALRALPRLRALVLSHDASPTHAPDDPFVAAFLPGAINLVQSAPLPFPELEVFKLSYSLWNVPETVPLHLPPGTADALAEILRSLLARQGDPGWRHYPFLRRFAFWITARGQPSEEHLQKMARLKEDLVRISREASVDIYCETEAW